MEKLKKINNEHGNECCLYEKLSAIQKILRFLNDYKPLLIILIFCIILSYFRHPYWNREKFMDNFMGYFFVFLSLFKFFDLKGFVDGFATYDLITQRVRFYGYLYPFIEFALGIAYLGKINSMITNFITFIVMLVSLIGVIKSIRSGQKIKCACLGTMLSVPLSTVSVLENLGMGAMAAYQLLTR